MRKSAAFILSFFLYYGVALGQATHDASSDASKRTTHAKSKASATKASVSNAVIAAQLEELRQAMHAQQEQLQLLKDELAKRDRQIDEAREAAAAANAHAAEATTKATEAENKATEVVNSQPTVTAAAVKEGTAGVIARVDNDEKDAAKLSKTLEGKIKAIGPFTFTGDFRLRDEPFFGGPKDQSQVRNRERFRVRLNINTKLNDDISGGLSLASGDINDPISTNQTTNQFYTRKPFTLDRAFITYNPHVFKPLVLTGGKFAYPFYRTELTWDNDLNPEGLAQTLQWNFESTPVLKRFALVGFELPFTEVAGVSANNKSIVQSAVYGGQVQAVWQLAGWLKLSTYGSFYNYHNADAIALALARASFSNPQTPGNGTLLLVGANVQNSITRTTVTPINSQTIPGPPSTVVTSIGTPTITNAQFASKFGLFDGIARFDIKTPLPRVPIVILGDYVQNTRACANVGNISTKLGTTVTNTSITMIARNSPCNSRERRGYWLEARAGRLSEPHDLQVAYTRMLIEREAVMGAFNFSDMRQNSNVSQHRVEVFYQAYKNIQFGFTGLFGRPLNFGRTTAPEPLLDRLQFDVIYKF